MGIFTFSNIATAIQMNGLGESFLLPMVLNMSITGSVAILFVLLVRLALKRTPKIFSYALWAVVLFRLLCPVSITTDFSLLGLFDTPTMENTEHTTAMEYVPFDVVHTRDLEVNLPVAPIINEAVNDVLPQEHAALGADPLEGEMAIASIVWLLGIMVMATYSAASYFRLRSKLLTASPLRENIYLADEITSPFVMGLIRPKIYLPSGMEEREQAYIIRHEQHHVRRGDHVIKVLAFLALSIHWFNPLVWVAFVYSNKDMEMSCDEAVVKKMGDGILADYTASLLSLATGKHIIAGMPLAFGEGDTKGRIRNLANWRKPAFCVVLTAVIACVALAVGLLTNPYDYGVVTDELQTTPCEAISIQVVNMHEYASPGIVEVTDTELIDEFVTRLQDAEYRKPLRKIGEAPDDLAADIALISNGKSFMRVLMLSSVSTGNEFEIYVIAENGRQYRMSAPLSISGSILALITSDGTESALREPVQEKELEYEIDDVRFIYESKQYDLSERNSQINEITDFFQIGKYLVLEGHTGPKHNVYCVFNTDTQTFEKDIMGANLTWYNNDINTAVYSYWSQVFTYDGRCLASYELNESENIYSLEYSEDGTQIRALIVSNAEDERTEIVSPNVCIAAYSDLNHNRISEQIVIRTVAPGQVYELAVMENGEEIWKIEASPAHVGWNTIMIYSEDGQDYLVQYNPSMFQGVGSYTCTVFSLEGNKQTVTKEWSVEFEVEPGNPVEVTETAEMTRFAREVGILLRNCYVLLSTEQGILVDRYAAASALPQIYPVQFNPDDIERSMETAANPLAQQELTSNAATFPTKSLELLYASGAGGWGTYLTLQPDGSFTGDYGDSDADTRYECKFEGRFTNMHQISDYCWAMTLGEVTIEKEKGTTWTEDGIHYIAAGPHGVSEGTDFLLYAPGTPVDVIPASCRDWWPDAYYWRKGEIDVLDGWALCNLNEGAAFYTAWLR